MFIFKLYFLSVLGSYSFKFQWISKDKFMFATIRQKMLRNKIDKVLAAEAKENPVTYNASTPYQGYGRIGLDGARMVEERFVDYDLTTFINSNSTILDIGSNSGFMVVEAALRARLAHGVEPSPHLNAIADLVAKPLGVARKTQFFDCTFEAFLPPNKYNLILSLAAFYTSDGRERSSAANYFGKIDEMLDDNGVVIYESTGYSPEDEPSNPFGTGARLASQSAADELYKRFSIIRDEERPVSNSPTARRRMIVARR
jgi:hypothetical protein